MSQHVAVLLLGSNIGEKEKNLQLALEMLVSAGCVLVNSTKILYSLPVDFVSYNYFCNIASSIIVRSTPIQLLQLIKNIEHEMGRKQDSSVVGRYEDRIIDIDIISFDSIKFLSKKLEIPHFKHVNERAFSQKLLMELEDLN